MLIGLVGKPSAGKSTFFKAATLAEVEIASYPFTTIKANHGIGYVKINCIDKEFNTQCNPAHGFCIKNKRFVPVELMDVAGLVPGASEGKGLGNQFLNDLRNADAFIHIIDISGTTDSGGKPAENHDPSKDVMFLEDELNKWYHNILTKAWKSFAKKSETEDVSFAEAVAKQFSGLKATEDQVKKVLSSIHLPEKPIIAANKVDLKKGKENYERIKIKFPGLIIIPCSADSELALREAAKSQLIDYIPGERDFKIKGDLSEKQKQALQKIKENILGQFETGTGVQAILNYAVFDVLKSVAVFPVDSANKLTDSKGKILPDCFLLPGGSTSLGFSFLFTYGFRKKLYQGN
jgi:ribosome-binding ATPase YchF (GTP1/OBG family)